ALAASIVASVVSSAGALVAGAMPALLSRNSTSDCDEFGAAPHWGGDQSLRCPPRVKDRIVSAYPRGRAPVSVVTNERRMIHVETLPVSRCWAFGAGLSARSAQRGARPTRPWWRVPCWVAIQFPPQISTWLQGFQSPRVRQPLQPLRSP